MVKQLRLFLISPTTWKLAFKIFTALLALYISQLLNFSGWAIFIFLFFWLFIYFSFPAGKHLLAVSFWLTGLLVFEGSKIIFNLFPHSSFLFLVYLAAAGLFFLLFGLMHLFFKNRLSIYNLFQNFLFLLLFLLFFFFLHLPYVFPLIFFLFLLLFLLFKEAFSFWGITFYRRLTISSLFLAFGATEIAWLVSFLSLDFLKAAIFLTLFVFISRDIALAHFQGNLTLSFVLTQIFLFFFLSLIIFIFSSWSPSGAL